MKKEKTCFVCALTFDDSHFRSLDEKSVDLDVLLELLCSTKGSKRKRQLASFDDENSELEECFDEHDHWHPNLTFFSRKNVKRHRLKNKKEAAKNGFSYKRYHITDSAITTMCKFFKEHEENFYSMSELERAWKKSNQKIPLKFTKDSE